MTNRGPVSIPSSRASSGGPYEVMLGLDRLVTQWMILVTA
ncbi:MAG: hypothetical protein AVDCRST_MAG59-2844 [uncultured Thermomicrobiales bacterium]|uniref:Uncharacterized protein n=1 Tax=uncultured Thermomicrobiales bacterium TaxID=1645740 RepID=A0A6J4V3S2_9BACT|nr:MAG: hypothetical protein AVDCRST_MAG59-2844 [uncultured Thermomicrobiales bacterium]